MASNQEIENGKNRVQEDMRAPLIQREVISANSNENKSLKGSGKEERCMVYLTTFVAVCGSYAFGSCVCTPLLEICLQEVSLKSRFLMIFYFAGRVFVAYSGCNQRRCALITSRGWSEYYSTLKLYTSKLTLVFELVFCVLL